MSKVTNPSSEGSVSCGFFNSSNDRKYNAEQMSSIFDGIIKDGIFASIGNTLVVSANSDNTVTVGTGKCWFNHTWTINDAPLIIECDEAETLQTRIDAIVVEVNSSPDVRDNFIKFVKGTPSQSNPVKPTMAKGEFINQHALCYITRTPGSTAISAANIENAVGTDETPFVTGILQTVSLDTLLGQWRQELDDFIAAGEAELDEFIADEESDFNTWYSDMKQLMSDVTAELNIWTTSEKNMILNWFEEMKDQLSEDAAANLQTQINGAEVNDILMHGFPDGTKIFSDDGTLITSVDSKGQILTKAFTDNFLTITSVLREHDNEHIPYPYPTFSGVKTKTVNGITFTDNSDGTVTVNGTATTDAILVLASALALAKGSYNLSGCPIGGSEETYYLGVNLFNNTTYVTAINNYGYETTLDTTTITYTTCNVLICVKSGVTVDNLTFNPKITNPGAELGRLVKQISADGKTISNTLTNYMD